MKKIFLFCMMALVAMVGLNSCSEDCDHDFIEHDYTQELVGTWSVIGPDAVEALVIKADGTMEFTGVHDGEFFESTARYELSNNRMRIIWDDGTIDEGRLNVVEGSDFSLVIDEGTGAGYYFKYCHEDFSEKLIGSWLFQDGISSQIWTYHADGTADCVSYYYLEEPYQTFLPGTYKLVGDILCETYEYSEDYKLSFGARLSITPEGSPFGDVLALMTATYTENDEYVANYVRVSPSLDLAGQKYEYFNTSVTNAEGEDKDVPFLNTSFNFAKMDGSIIDKFLKSILFTVEFPDANTLKYSYWLEGQNIVMTAPIEIDGNKMTIKMSENVPVYQDVVVYTFQNMDNTQLQLNMPTASFEKFFGNTSVAVMLGHGQLDINDTEAIAGVYQTIADAVESINLGLVMHSNK